MSEIEVGKSMEIFVTTWGKKMFQQGQKHG